jgi:hypothetical protein
MTDWRERCAELADRLDDALTYTVQSDTERSMRQLITRTRAELAQPEPQEVIPDHVNLIAFAYSKEPWATWLKTGGCLESAHCELSDLMLAVLARFGRPAIEPAPEPEVLTDEELDIVVIAIQRLAPHRPDGPTQPTHDLYAVDRGREILKQHLARYARPAIEPVPVRERLPGEGDCDAEGRCWIGTWNHIEDEDVFELLFDWSFSTPRDWTWSGIAHIQYWLPHWALPVPTPLRPAGAYQPKDPVNP